MNKIFFIFISLFSIVFAEHLKQPNQVDQTQNKKVLVEKLKSLVFQDKYSEIRDLKDPIVIDNVDIPDPNEFKRKIKEFIGEPITLEKLDEIKVFVVNYFRKEGYPLVGVNIPAGQDITDGSVYVIIQVAKLGKVEVEGARYFSKERIKKQVRLKPGEKISTNKVIQDLEWLNDNPFRNVNAIYQAGDKLNETDVILNVEDRFPYRVYAGYENSSYTIAGSSRFVAGFNMGNLFKSDQQLNFQFMSAKKFNDWWGIAGNYVIPLPWKNILKFLGSYSRAISDEQQFQSVTGKGWTVASRYEIPLPIIGNLSHDFILGFDFKRTNNFLLFADNLVFNRFIDVAQFLLKYQGTYDDSFGVTSFELSAFYSPGGITKNNKTSNFAIERPGAKSNYGYIDLDIERVTRLKADLSWVVNFLGQLSFSKLLLSEQLSLGGNFTVRGYMENEVTGDSGILLKNELRFPNIRFQRKGLKNALQFLAFLDYGFATDVDKSIVESSKSLLSVGPGVRFNMSTYLTLRFDYGFQLITVGGRTFQNGGKSRGHLSVIASY
ncbi:MAG: Heme/hemopexin transporter protein HuxB [Candidatus Anoxychlamydiales bacterium]|nr:Heme/hemopexin transporter protein HuxB [Candidatus Anoxychlamydiales bacterium]